MNFYWVALLAGLSWGLCGGVGLAQSVPPPGVAFDRASTGDLPALGEGDLMSSSAERRLGDRIAQEIYRQADYLDDPVLADYVQEIWQPLLTAARLRGEVSADLDAHFAWDVLLLRDRTVNAFALPGGYLGLNLGLLALVSNADELSSVLAHELSHVTQRHVARLIARQAEQAPWLIGSMILGVLAASRNPDAGNALFVGSQALSAQGQLNFSRDMERQADRLGLGLMTQAGFGALGMVTMFEKLQQASRLNDNGSYPYLRSHPLTTERIADMRSRLGSVGLADVPPPTPLAHALAATRAAVLLRADTEALRGWIAQASAPGLAELAPPQRLSTLYGAALAALRLRDAAAGEHWLAQLQALPELADPQSPAGRPVAYLAVEAALSAGDLVRAKSRLTALLPAGWADASAAAAPGPVRTANLRRPALMLWAELAARAGDSAEQRRVSRALAAWVLTHPRDALAWQWLASINTALGLPLSALRAQAEVQAARLDHPGALDRLLAAQVWLRQNGSKLSPADAVEAAIVEVRRRQIESRLREDALER